MSSMSAGAGRLEEIRDEHTRRSQIEVTERRRKEDRSGCPEGRLLERNLGRADESPILFEIEYDHG